MVWEEKIPVVFIMYVMCDILEVLHVGLDEKPSEERKVGVLGVVHFDETPRILTTTNLFPLYLKRNENVKL